MKKPYSKAQRILAITGIVLLVGLYLAALIASFFKSDLAQSILWSALFCTFFIPLMIWLFQWTTGIIGRHDDENDSSEK